MAKQSKRPGLPRGRKPGPSRADASSTVWSPPSDFGGYLSGLRAAKGLSYRGAAELLGVSFAYVHKLENEPLAGPPDLGLLSRIAAVYEQDLQEVVEAAGMRVRVTPLDPRVAGVRDQFRQAFFSQDHPELGLNNLSEPDMVHLPDRHMNWMIGALLAGVEFGSKEKNAPRLIRKILGMADVYIEPAGDDEDGEQP